MVNSIIEGLTNFFLECPLLKDGVFRVDALGNDAVEYAIEKTGPTDPIITQYLDGSSIRQFQFNFHSREYYSLDRIQNIGNDAFYEAFCDWVEQQNKLENFPEVPEGCEAQRIVVQSTGFMLDESMTNARYEVQLNLEYFKEA